MKTEIKMQDARFIPFEIVLGIETVEEATVLLATVSSLSVGAIKKFVADKGDRKPYLSLPDMDKIAEIQQGLFNVINDACMQANGVNS